MKGKRNLMFLAMAVCLMGLGLPGTALAVDAFAECAYTKNDVVCYVYANTGADDLISAGVKLTYDANDLALAGTTKNDADWYFGDGTTNYPYMSPEEVADGVIYIVGKLDTNAPQAGVNGPRLLIGTASFNRKTANVPVIGLDYGRTAPYVNFVSTTGADLDGGNGGVGFSTKVVERGDANASGSISTRDLNTLNTLLNAGNYVVYADCNASGTLTTRDLNCLNAMLMP